MYYPARHLVFLVVLLSVLALQFVKSQTNCPHAQAGLTLWSQNAAWNQNGAQVLITGGSKVLLNSISSSIKLRSITIESNAELIFADANIALNVDFIRVSPTGKLIMGSETCPILNKIVITLWGNRTLPEPHDLGTDPSDGGAFGSKGIAIATGATLQIFGKVPSPTWTFLSVLAQNGSTTIKVEDAVDWKVGDDIVIATTDYAPVFNRAFPSSVSYQRSNPTLPDQNEERKIVAIAQDKKTITLDRPLQFMHYRDSQGWERAEVGHLTRNIVIQGDPINYQNYGAHIMIRNGELVQIQGLEVTRMGQSGILGRYPIHFHMINPFDKTGLNWFVKGCSIHHNNQRCLVIHHTNGIVVQDNVAYRTNGHCYFLEEGGERSNVFDHNLGIAATPVALEDTSAILIPTDNRPSMFWITNPNNTYTRNSAVQANFGYWFSLPTSPVGMSASFYTATDPEVRPRITMLKEFSNNIAHSHYNSGLFLDDFLLPDGTTELGGLSARRGPFIGTNLGASVESTYVNVTSYRNRAHGIWIRSGPTRVTNAVLIGNRIGVNLVPGPTLIENSMIIAETANIGAPRSNDFGRTRPDANSATTLIKAASTYDNGGPQYYRNLTIIGFNSTILPNGAFRPSGAFGILDNAPFIIQTRNKYVDITLIDSNSFFLPNNNRTDSPRGFAMQDIDGSTFGKFPGSWIVANNPLLTGFNPGCQFVTAYNATLCPLHPYNFIQLFLIDNNLGATGSVGENGVDYSSSLTSNVRATFYELGYPERNMSVYGRNPGSPADLNKWQLMMNLATRRGYTVRWTFGLPTPSDLSVRWDSNCNGDWLVFAIPYPASAQPFYVNSTLSGTPFRQVFSLKELDRTSYYYDTRQEHLYLKFINSRSPNSWTNVMNWNLTECSGDGYTVRIMASCADCHITQSDIPALVSMDEELYRADLDACQNADTLNVKSTGNGVGFFLFNPLTRELNVQLHHNLSSTATSIVIGTGAIQQNYTRLWKLANAKLSFASPARAALQLAYNDWVALVKGQFFFKIATTNYPDGEIKGHVMCMDPASCTLPPALSVPANPCDDNSYVSSFPLYTDTLNTQFRLRQNINSAEVNQTIMDVNNTAIALCGSKSLRIRMKASSFDLLDIASPRPVIDSATTPFLQFYARAAVGNGRIPLTVIFNNGSRDLGRVNVNSTHIMHYAIDDSTWTRVLIPLSQLGFASPNLLQQPLYSVRFQMTDTSDFYEFFLDEIRIVNLNLQSETMVSVVARNEIKQYTTICGSVADISVPLPPKNPTPPETTVNTASAASLWLVMTLSFLVMVVIV